MANDQNTERVTKTTSFPIMVIRIELFDQITSGPKKENPDIEKAGFLRNGVTIGNSIDYIPLQLLSFHLDKHCCSYILMIN